MAASYWTLHDPGSVRKLSEWDHGSMRLEQVICTADPGHQRAGKRLTNLSVVLPGGPVQDFVWTWYAECLMQDGVLNLLRREGFTGFEVRQVNARLKNVTESVPTLWELVITGWGGVARPESGIKLVQYCTTCQHSVYSGLQDAERLVDPDQWDGSDFFIVWPMPKFIFVTERVAHWVRDHRFTGVSLERAFDYKAGRASADTLTPGRLSYWMPESRATELGRGAGIAEI